MAVFPAGVAALPRHRAPTVTGDAAAYRALCDEVEALERYVYDTLVAPPAPLPPEPPLPPATGGAEPFDVTAFGARGDGTGDDTAAVRAALAAAAASGRWATVFFPAGTYPVDHLVVPARVSLRGAGLRATVLRNREASGGTFVTLYGSHVTVRDLFLDGQRAAQPVDAGLAALLVAKPNNPTGGGSNISGGLLLVAGPAAGATSLAVSTAVMGTDAVPVLPGDVITLLEGAVREDVRVAQTYSGGNAIALQWPLQNAFTTAAKVSCANTHVTVRDCLILGAGRGCLAFWHAVDCKALDNYLRDCSDSCLDLPSGGGRHVQFRGNHIETDGRWGITVDEAEQLSFGRTAHLTIADNQIHFVHGGTDPAGNTVDGIFVGSVESILVRGNTVDLTRAGDRGIRVAQTGQFCLIAHNEVYGRGTGGTTRGIACSTTATAGDEEKRLLVVGNLLRDLNRAVELDGSTAAQVVGNYVHNVTTGLNTEAHGTAVQRVVYTGNVVDGCVTALRLAPTAAAGSTARFVANLVRAFSFLEIDAGAGWTLTRDERPLRWLSALAALDFGSIAAGATAELTITVAGAASGDAARATPANGIEAGLVWSAYCSAANTVTIRLANITAAAINPAARNWRAEVAQW
jgi:hypothetical protein